MGAFRRPPVRQRQPHAACRNIHSFSHYALPAHRIVGYHLHLRAQQTAIALEINRQHTVRHAASPVGHPWHRAGRQLQTAVVNRHVRKVLFVKLQEHIPLGQLRPLRTLAQA